MFYEPFNAQNSVHEIKNIDFMKTKMNRQNFGVCGEPKPLEGSTHKGIHKLLQKSCHKPTNHNSLSHK